MSVFGSARGPIGLKNDTHSQDSTKTQPRGEKNVKNNEKK